MPCIGQIANLEQSAMSVFTADNIAALSPDIYMSFSADHIENLQPETFASFSDMGVGRLDPDALSALDASMLAAMPNDTLSGFQGYQIQSLSDDILGELSGEQFAALNPGAISELTAEQVSALSPDIFSGDDSGDGAQQLEHLSTDALGGLTTEHIGSLPEAMQTQFTVAQSDAPSGEQWSETQMIPNALSESSETVANNQEQTDNGSPVTDHNQDPSLDSAINAIDQAMASSMSEDLGEISQQEDEGEAVATEADTAI